MKRIKILLAFIAFIALPFDVLAVEPSQSPLFMTSPVEPRVMLVMSRDHELSKKAYNDYSDLNNDGTLDSTYTDSIDYYGYFDSLKCYSYSTGNGRFEPEALATGTYKHHCSGQWSGNFLNWATMTRMDVVRKVLYGGFRSTDETGTSLGKTVLERHVLPNDVHAFAKVYAPNGATGNGTEIAKYTPYSPDAGISLCNVTDVTATKQFGNINTVNGVTTSDPPLIKVASGQWRQWAMSEITQCIWREQKATAEVTRPTSTSERLTGGSDLIARVAVCAPGLLEDKCKAYSTATKPFGLLQQYSDEDETRLVQFGLISGSYKKNKSGGVLRENIKRLAGNNNSKDEIDQSSGQFINQTVDDNGIINTINRLHIAGWKTSIDGDGKVSGGGYGNADPFACSANNLLGAGFIDGTDNQVTCADWGNPLSEMYYEALRYFAGKATSTTAYSVVDSAATRVIRGLNEAAWNASSDPLPESEWCALSNIIVLSTGLNSFDKEAITSDITDINPTTLTDKVGELEGLANKDYLIGSNGTTSTNQCGAKSYTSLSAMSGICPEIPHLQGGYQLAGLAYGPRKVDIRPAYSSLRSERWNHVNNDWVTHQPVNTFAVALAEAIPSFDVNIGGTTVTILPACRSGGSTVCSMTDLVVESSTATSGSLLVSWEDGTAGSDYDMDIVERLQYAVSGGQIIITVSAVQSATGANPMELGYIVTGSTQDATYYPIKLPGTATGNAADCGGGSANYNFFSLLTNPPAYRCGVSSDAWPSCPGGNPKLPDGIVNSTGCPADQTGGAGSNCGCPKAWTFTPGASSASLLKSPLWYAAKYGGFVDSNENQKPDLQSEWDATNNITGAAGSDGEPDNYFDVRNPAQLFDRLSSIIDRVALKDASASAVATNSTRLDTQSVVYQAKFSSEDWSGQLVAYELNTDGTLGDEKWNTDDTLQLNASRNIKTYNGSAAVPFLWANLTCLQKAYLDKASDPVASCSTGTYVAGTGDGQGENRLNWLRGQNGISGMRTRTKVLGDIVNSDPIFVKEENFGHIGYTTGVVGAYVDTYTEYLQTKKSRTPMIYIGANDGMLHAFDADTGEEKFAYVPNAVFKNLYKLTDPGYSHQYYVDGTFGMGDAYYDSGDGTGWRWRTVLVGNLGAGGRAVFALDVTDPDNIKVIWEKDHQDTADTRWANLGHMLGAPVITTVLNGYSANHAEDGYWTVVFGNGYDSDTQRAMLFIVDLKTGLIGNVVDTEAGSAASSATHNGLSSPALYITPIADRQLKRLGDVLDTDAIYAGDMLGNLWKFLNVAGTNAWKVAYKSGADLAPLFIATDDTKRQPITSPLEIGATPSGETGVMLYFGTGRYFVTGDQSSPDVQTLYGIWDSGSGIGNANNRAQLVEQTIDHQLTVNSKESRIVSNNSVTLDKAGNNKIYGWYMDLKDPPSPGTAKGERVVSAPLLRHGRVIFTTLVPASTACSYGGNSWLMELDAKTGGRLTYSVFDMNDDKLFNELDYVDHDNDSSTAKLPISGIRLDTGISKTPAVISAGETEYKVTSGTSGAILVTSEKGMSGHPRASWREIREE